MLVSIKFKQFYYLNVKNNFYFMKTEKLLERGEAIEGIETKADDLRVKTADFDRQARNLKCKMCQENAKMCVCLVAVIVVSIIVVKCV